MCFRCARCPRILARNLPELPCTYGYGLDGMEMGKVKPRARPKLSNAYMHQAGAFSNENAFIFERLLDFAPV